MTKTPLADALDAAHEAVAAHVHPVNADDTRLLTVWAAHTHLVGVHDRIEHSPRLRIDSTRYGSGKSTVLRVLAHLCPASRTRKLGTRLTEANLRRSLMDDSEAHRRQTVWLLDEADKWLKQGDKASDALVGLLNDGFAWDGTTSFLVGDEHTPTEVSTFTAAATSGNNVRVLADMDSRSLVVLMAPSGAAKHNSMRRRDGEKLAGLGDGIATALESTWDDLPDAEAASAGIGWNDARTRNLWEPLLQVAALAGADWEMWATLAAEDDARRREARSDELSEQLPDRLQALVDVLAWAAASHKVDDDFIPTEEIVNVLGEGDPGRWGMFARDRKPLTPSRLGGLWSGLSITSQRPTAGGRRGHYVGTLRNHAVRLGVAADVRR